MLSAKTFIGCLNMMLVSVPITALAQSCNDDGLTSIGRASTGEYNIVIYHTLLHLV